jgi:hypothetical protein
MFVLGGVLIVGGGVAALALLWPRIQAEPVRETPAHAATTPPAAATPAPRQVVEAPTPKKAERVKLRIQSRPKQVDVYLDGKKIGTTPEVVRVPVSDDPIEIEFRAPGFLPEKVTVTPKDDALVKVSLRPERRAAKKPGGGTQGDLEF